MKTDSIVMLVAYVVGLLYLAAPSAATSSASTVVGYVQASGVCFDLVTNVQLDDPLLLALSDDIQQLLVNASDVTSGGAVQDNVRILDVVVSEVVEVSNKPTDVRFVFHVTPTEGVEVTAAVVLGWSSRLSLLAMTQEPNVLAQFTPLYAALVSRQVNGTVSTTAIADCQLASPSSNASGRQVLIVAGACTIENASPTSDDDQCGPFSCYGFAMVALVVALFLLVGITILCCCTRWRGGRLGALLRCCTDDENKNDNHVNDDKPTMPVKASDEYSESTPPFPIPSPTTVAVDVVSPRITARSIIDDDDTDDDPFSTSPDCTPQLAPAPTTPPLLDGLPPTPLLTTSAASRFSSSSTSHPSTTSPMSRRPGTPRRLSVVKIHAPLDTAPTTTVALPLAIRSSTPTSRHRRSGSGTRSPTHAAGHNTPQQPSFHDALPSVTSGPSSASLDEERRKLQSQPWIWRHLDD